MTNLKSNISMLIRKREVERERERERDREGGGINRIPMYRELSVTGQVLVSDNDTNRGIDHSNHCVKFITAWTSPTFLSGNPSTSQREKREFAYLRKTYTFKVF